MQEKTAQEVKEFFKYLVNERKLNFHPNDDFANYVSYDEKTPSFTKEEVDVYNRLMEESFKVCDATGVDIYEIGLQELKKALEV